MNEVLSKFTDKYFQQSSHRSAQSSHRSVQQKEQIEIRFRESRQTYVFPRIECSSVESQESMHGSLKLKKTIESPKQNRLKTEGNEKFEEEPIDFDFNFNSSSERISEDAIILESKQLKKQVKPPISNKQRNSQTLPYKTIQSYLPPKVNTMNCKTVAKDHIKSQSINRLKSTSNSSAQNAINNKRPATVKSMQEYSVKQFTQCTPIQSQNKQEKNHIKYQDYLLQILAKHKSKSNEQKMQGPIFHVNNSNINLNLNINSRTVEAPRKQKNTPQSTMTVTQILKKKTTLANRSNASSQQRNTNRCSTEPANKLKPRSKKTKVSQQSRCNTNLDKQMQNTQQYLNNMKIQQSLQIKMNKKLQSSVDSKYKKQNLQLEMI